MSEHHFDVEFATIYGIEEAIIINTIDFWLQKNKAKEQNKYENKYWTKFTAEELLKYFPYLTESKIKYAINNLLKKDVIIAKQFDKNKWDRTNYYTFSSKFLTSRQSKITYSITENSPIDDGNLNSDYKDNKYKIINKDKNNNMTESNYFKNQFKKEIKENNISIKYINIFHSILDKNNISNKKEDSMKEANLRYANLYIEKYIKEFKSEEKFKDAFIQSLLCFDNNYDTNKDKIPKILSHFLHFPRNKYIPSNFLHYYNKPPKLLVKLKNKYPLYVRDYANILGIDETDELISFVNRLASFNMEIRNKKINGYTRDQLTPISEQDTSCLYTIYNDYIRDIYGFLNQFEIWLDEKTDYEDFKWNEKFFDSYMKEFNKWFYNRHDGTVFFISNEIMQDKLNEYLQKNK